MPGIAVRMLATAMVASIALLGLGACGHAEPKPAATQSSQSPAAQTPQTPAVPSPPGFDKLARSIDDPTSIWVVSNKLRPLDPVNYAPADLVAVNVRGNVRLRQAAAPAMEAMFAAASAEGAGQLQVQNAYRSYSTQVSLHNQWVSSLGKAKADAQSARAGFSEHQTGLTADIEAYPGKCDISACFADTPQGQWLAANAWRFGFLLRYPADKTAITGYIFEPWHYRYVGAELATEMHTTGVTTLEEFFGLPPAPDYAG